MKILFNIEYLTAYGEQLVLNIIGPDGAIESHTMSTVDGHEWTFDYNTAAPTEATTLTYYYSVKRGDEVVRTEWLVEPHKQEIQAEVLRYTMYDRWIEIPEDSYMYSSAFTDCVLCRERKAAKASRHSTQVVLKVRAPQLLPGDRLAVVGTPVYLGEWEPQKSIHMAEHQPNEWVVCLDGGRLPADAELKFIVLRDNGDVLWEKADNRHLLLPEMQKGEALCYDLEKAWFDIPLWKGAGTVVPVFALRSEGSFGVGDFGDLKTMVDWCAKTGQRVLQILPINDSTITHTWQDSYPYNSISIYALHPQYTDFRQLPELKDEEQRNKFEKLRVELNSLPQIDYERVNRAKREYLHLVFAQEWGNIKRRTSYKTFFDNNKYWLEPYARFCVNRDKYGTADFAQWPEGSDKAEIESDKLDFWYFVQYNLDQQMRAAHEHARKQRVILKGDIPIGISRDGVEAWVEPRYFNLNGQAGAPPDAFSANGQNWGFPTYNWDAMLADGCSWWVRRFRKMSEYFDAYRIDHVLGFFRIWEIPIDAVHGLLGQFSPALGMTREDIEAYGLPFNEEHMTRPFIANWTLQRVFGERTAYVKEHFLDLCHDDIWQMKPEFDTQRKVLEWSKGRNENDLRDGLYALISDVLFVRDRKDPNKFHPRIGVQNDFVYEALWDKDKDAFNRLYNDYFYRRNNQYWYHEAMKKLPLLTQATRMLVCAEDLGMVPDCVPWVMNELRILSLEIQSMPKDPTVTFGQLPRNPYRSVCTISTHDMSTLRQWWDEDMELTQKYYGQMLHHEGPAPHPLPGNVAQEIVTAHLMSPSMLCLLSLQDWLSIDERLRLPDQNAERINIPANPRHYWRYRMHLNLESLMKADDFNKAVAQLVAQSGR
jgi:4-alpha-glucanotransferase